jgi:hypothetical protein
MVMEPMSFDHHLAEVERVRAMRWLCRRKPCTDQYARRCGKGRQVTVAPPGVENNYIAVSAVDIGWLRSISNGYP